MGFLTALIDSLVGLVRRNPLTVLTIVLLGLLAPALLRGIALFILYFIMFLILLVIVGVLLFRWRVVRIQRQMEEQFGAGPGASHNGGFYRDARAGARTEREGDVKIRRTSAAPGKRVSDHVGDYVDFEETKD